METDPEPET